MKADRIQRNIGTGKGCILILKFRSLRSIGFLSRKLISLGFVVGPSFLSLQRRGNQGFLFNVETGMMFDLKCWKDTKKSYLEVCRVVPSKSSFF